MARQINFQQILQDEASFQLVRTNPKLTGNVKLTIDSNDSMWLNSIDVNEELSKSIYKRKAIDPSISLPGNMFNFFTQGNTPSEIIFDLSENFDSTKTSTDYKDQYDFDHYFSGANYLTSRRYSEKLSYFAPIYLKEDIPEYFVIFKISDPLNNKIDEMKNDFPFNRENYLKDLFKKSTIIKTFDLRQSTKVGKYLRDYLNDPQFPISPLNVSYDEDKLTNFNGILYNSGVFGSRGENLYNFYRTSNPLKYFEEFITLGFERNGVIFPNILNLEFIFDDDTSEAYDFNRYVGMYVNTIELSKMDTDLDRAYSERSNWENTPRFRREYFEWEDIKIDQYNPDGVILPVKNLDVYLSDFKNIFSDKDNMFFNYIADRRGNLHLPKLDDPYNIDYDDNNNERYSANIRLSDRYLNMGDMFGPGKVFIQDKGFHTSNKAYSHAYIKIDKLTHLDAFKIYHPHGTRIDSNGKYELIEGVSGFAPLPGPTDFYAFIDVDGVNGNDTFYFNIDGSKLEVAKSLIGCLNNIRNASFKAYLYGEYIFIKSNISGDHDSMYAIEFISLNNVYDGVTINDNIGNTLINNVINFEGGCPTSGNRLIIDSDHFNKINNKISDILIKTESRWSRIKKISKYVDLITEENSITSLSRSNAISSFFGKMSIVLELDHIPKVESGDFTMVIKHRPPFGLLSFFPIRDFDFDFYSSEYLNFPQVDLFNHYYIPSNMAEIDPSLTYDMYGEGTIQIIGTTLQFQTSKSSPGTVVLPPSYASGGPYAYEVLNGDVIIEATGQNPLLGDNLWIPIEDENGSLNNFPGFFLLKDPDKVISERPDDLLFQRRDKYLNGIAKSEYDFYKENSSKDFALKSKVVPYISKWVYPDGLDSRSNPYRLNTELVFGFNNFAPDHEDRSQNPSNFTHEWFYIESRFNYINHEDTIKLNNSYFEEPFDLNKALTVPGYFIDYFTYTPTFNGKEIGTTQTRYSPIRKNNIGVYETFFKGFKIQFKDYIDETNLNEAGKPISNSNTNKYDGYKFTCLLKTIKEDINDDSTPPIRYRFIEHEEFKFVMLLIELSIGSLDNINEYWKMVQSIQYDGITNLATDSPGIGAKLKFIDAIPGDTELAYNSINGDYRIDFSNINGLDISNINHTLIYSLKHKKFNSIENNFSNIRLSTKLSLNTSGVFNTDTNIDSIGNNKIPNYPANLKDEIGVFNPKTFVIGYNAASNDDKIIDSLVGISPLNVNEMVSAQQNFITYSTSIGIGLVDLSTNLVTNLMPSPISNQFVQSQYTFKIMTGGELYFETLFEKLSFGEFKEFVNKLNPFIEYESYSYNGTSLVQKTSKFYTEIPDTSNVTKIDAIITQIDTNKPSNLSFNNVIGFTYERSSLDNTYEINRYGGGFVPLFKDVFIFNSKFNFTKNDIEPLDLSSTKFNIDVDSFLRMYNFSHIKVSNNKILDLESDNEFEPKYEIANEIAIGRENYDLFLSNWDYGFHHKYINKSEKIPVSGSLRIEEDNSFISKLINLKTDIELESFIIDKVNNIDNINLDNIELVYTENDTTISGKINVKNVITSFLLNDGISNKFNEFLVANSEFIGNFETIEDYVIEYINLNILKLYEITDIEFYTKKDRTLIEQSENSNTNSIEFRLLDDKERFEQGYKLNRNLRINKLDRFTLTFEFAKELDSGTLVSPKIKIKFI